ncbi:MAG: hypothetical protein RI564_08450, partial [Gracilimonas sp.]|nr:hypothetical protein [Gracilimonas sp.]
MKNLLFLSLFFFIPFTFTQAQSVDTGIQFYEEGSYQKALDIFENINTSEAFLFAGKSHYALTNYLKAKYYLNSVDEADKVFHDEALYTLALVEFQLKNFAASLDALHKLNKSSPSPSVSRDAYDFYSDLLDYLSP